MLRRVELDIFIAGAKRRGRRPARGGRKAPALEAGRALPWGAPRAGHLIGRPDSGSASANTPLFSAAVAEYALPGSPAKEPPMSTRSTISKKAAITDPDQGPAPGRKRMTVPDFMARKGAEPLVCLTSYEG